MTKLFQDLERFDSEDVRAALARDDPKELQFVSITLALSSPDAVFAQDICLRLCAHENRTVRANAIMSLGHIARRFRMLDERMVKPVIEAALRDPDDQVRMLAKSSADEVHQFLHWDIAGHVYG